MGQKKRMIVVAVLKLTQTAEIGRRGWCDRGLQEHGIQDQHGIPDQAPGEVLPNQIVERHGSSGLLLRNLI